MALTTPFARIKVVKTYLNVSEEILLCYLQEIEKCDIKHYV